MSVLGQVLRRPQAAITTSYQLDQHLRGAGFSSAAGAVVTAETAMTIGAVYACVRVLAETLAQIPLLVYRRTDAGRERDPGHWLYPLLHDQPNPWQTSFEFREMMQAHLALAGNAYALKTVVRGETRELLPIAPHRVIVEQDERYQITYKVSWPDGTIRIVAADRMLHLAGLSWNGLSGLSVVGYMREVLGIALQEQKFAAKLYANGAAIRGVVQHPKAFKSEESIKRFRAGFEETYSGAENAHKVMVLEEGATFVASGMTARDAEFLAERRFTRSEIAGAFRVPLHLINDLERSTNNNIEHQSLEFAKFTMAPWVARWEGRLAVSLLSRAERGTHYVRFLMQGLERGDLRTRVDSYGKAINDGWMTPNEVRQLEDMNREEGLDEFRVPLNMRVAGDPPPQPPAPQNRIAALLNGNGRYAS